MGCKVFLCADNTIERLKLNKRGETCVYMIFSSSLEQHITLPTRVAGNTVKLIDHIWTNCSSTVQSGVFDTGISDHHITFAFIPSCIERKLTHEKFRDHSESCLEALENSLINKIILSETFNVRWDECSNFDEKFSLSVQSYTNCMTLAVQSEPR